MNSKKLWLSAAAMGLVLAATGAWSDDASSTASDHPVKDSYITTKVKAELVKDKTTKARDIHVDTKDGVVMLTGSVGSDAEKQMAEMDAKKVKHVASVENDLKVVTP